MVIPALTPDEITRAKAAMRRDSMARRDALDPVARTEAGHALAQRPLPIEIRPGMVVSGYGAIRSELNPLSLLRKCAAAGAQLALPCVVGRGHPLMFRAWAPGDPLKRDSWGLGEPLPERPQVQPDLLFVPLAAFDRRGYRVGYGAGYYDMTLNALRARKHVAAWGLAFAVQEVDRVPTEPHDARLDGILTERETIGFEPL
jgi:5-formyltetrahydrofolate cyclo-ligase